MDHDLGRILDLLKSLGIAERTLVIFTSDNGPHNEAGHNPKRFRPSGPLRGMKRDLYEGGIRVPAIAWWPGSVSAGTASDHIGYFGDLMATACELAGVEPPSGLDSVSFLPTLWGRPDQQEHHEYLYWEFYERGGRRAVRWGDWKGVRLSWNGATELYDLAKDLGETQNLAQQNPDVVRRIDQMMDRAHQPSPQWKPPSNP
jgi:uncharacterized sulfatase